MRHIEQVDLKGKTYYLFNHQDLLDLICDQMGSQVAALVDAEFKERLEETEELKDFLACVKTLLEKGEKPETILKDLTWEVF